MPDVPASSAGPVWDSITHDVLCPLCEYNLRGLSEARCPECGYRFEWAVVTDPRKRLHPYLFEHHPERNVRSFFRTLWGTIRAGRFWSSLSPTQPLQPGRLAVYWVLSSACVFLAVAGQWARAIYRRLDSNYGWSSSAPPFSIADLLSAAKRAWEHDSSLTRVLYCAIFWLVWPWLTLLALLIFRASMRRAKVRIEHIDRCLVYSFDIGAWLGLLAGSAAVLSIWFDWRILKSSTEFDLAIGGAILLVVVVVRLWLAYRLYLRFDHAFWVIVASQLIVFLFVANMLLVWMHVRGPQQPGDIVF